MTAMRDPKLQTLLDHAGAQIGLRAEGAAARAAARVFAALRERTGEAAAPNGEPAQERLAVITHHLGAALSAMAVEPPPLPEMAAAFAALEPRLRWARRRTSTEAAPAFHHGHANATLVGPGGLEQRDDVWVGVSLVAPGVLYPDHDHPPEEVYLACSGGAWRNAEMGWTSPGPGGIIYNPPGITHSMKAEAGPLLALWILPIR